MNDEFVKKLLHEENWDDLISDYVLLQHSKVPLEMLPEMAETLSEFFKAHDLLDTFMKWCIEKEINNTKDYNLLFREDSFVIMLLNRLVFGDVGIRYLQEVTSKLLQRLLEVDKPLEVNRMRVDAEEATKNTLILLRYIDEFLPYFAKQARACPSPLRKAFAVVQQVVDTKFGKKETPFVMEFLFFHFICPCLINPKKYSLIQDDPPTKALPGLVNVSKLLNDISLKSLDKYKEKEVNDFIVKRHPLLLQFLHILTDEKDVDPSKQRSTSLSNYNFTVEERELTSSKLKQFFISLAYFHRKGSMTCMNEEYKVSSQSNEMYQIKLKEFIDKLQDPNWKKEKETAKFSSFVIRDKDVPSRICIRSEAIFDAPMSFVTPLIKKYQWEKDSLISGHETLFISDKYSEHYCMYKLPFPLSNRDAVYMQWEYKVEENRIFIMYDNLSKKVARKKGFVRGQLSISGWFIEINPDNQQTCRVVSLFQYDPKGSLPLWVVNIISSTSSNKLLTLKELIEKKHKKSKSSK